MLDVITSRAIKFIWSQAFVCNRYCMVGSALWIIKPVTPRAKPEGEGLYNP